MLAIEVEQGELTFECDRGKKWLRHQRAVRVIFREFIRSARSRLVVETKSAARISANHRLDDDFGRANRFDQLRQLARIQALTPNRRHNGHAALSEIAQVSLAKVPLDEIAVVVE